MRGNGVGVGARCVVTARVQRVFPVTTPATYHFIPPGQGAAKLARETKAFNSQFQLRRPSSVLKNVTQFTEYTGFVTDITIDSVCKRRNLFLPMAQKRSMVSREALASPRDDLGSRRRELRLRRQASLGDVARAIGTTGQHLSAIERSQIENPGYKTVLALANYYGVPITRLIDDPDAHLTQNLSIEQAIEVLRSNASPEGRAAVVLVVQHLLAMGWCMSDSHPSNR